MIYIFQIDRALEVVNDLGLNANPKNDHPSGIDFTRHPTSYDLVTKVENGIPEGSIVGTLHQRLPRRMKYFSREHMTGMILIGRSTKTEVREYQESLVKNLNTLKRR